MLEVPKWWHFLLRGLLALIFGVVVLVWPGATVLVLLVFFGCFVLVEGVFAVITSIFQAKKDLPWLGLMLLGLVGIVIGVLTLARPGVTAEGILYVIAAWAIIHGVFQIVHSFELPSEFKGRWLLGLAGALSIIVGVLLIAFPGIGLFTIILIISIYAMVSGAVLIITSFWVRSQLNKFDRPAAA